ncbi:hypothetical protein ACQPTN_11495 [Bradyrhizobium sp. 13971]
MAVLVRAIQLTDYDLRRALRSNWSKNVTIAFTLLLTSTLVGLATSLYFRVWTLMLESPLVAVLAAIVLQSDGFSFATGAPIVVACLAFNQFAYLAGALLSPGPTAQWLKKLTACQTAAASTISAARTSSARPVHDGPLPRKRSGFHHRDGGNEGNGSFATTSAAFSLSAELIARHPHADRRPGDRPARVMPAAWCQWGTSVAGL